MILGYGVIHDTGLQSQVNSSTRSITDTCHSYTIYQINVLLCSIQQQFEKRNKYYGLIV